MEIGHNPFAKFSFQSVRQSAGGAALAKTAQSISASLKIKDEFIPSTSVSSGTFKRPPAVSVNPPEKNTETTEQGETEASPQPKTDFSWEVFQLSSDIYKIAVSKYNNMYHHDSDSKIANFSLKIDDKGKLIVTDVQTEGNDPKANAKAAQMISRWLTDEIKEKAEELGLAILTAHNDVHQDVLFPDTDLEALDEEDRKKLFKHEIAIASGLKTEYKVLSPDADAAALREMEELTKDAGDALRNFFKGALEGNESFSLLFSQEGKLSLASHSFNYANEKFVKELFEQFNNAADGGSMKRIGLPHEFEKAAEKLSELKKVMDKIHDKSLLSEEGIRFAF